MISFYKVSMEKRSNRGKEVFSLVVSEELHNLGCRDRIYLVLEERFFDMSQALHAYCYDIVPSIVRRDKIASPTILSNLLSSGWVCFAHSGTTKLGNWGISNLQLGNVSPIAQVPIKRVASWDFTVSIADKDNTARLVKADICDSSIIVRKALIDASLR